MPATRHHLRIEPLSREAFAPFGDVIEASEDATHYEINGGTAVRYHDLAAVDVSRQSGRAVLSIFRAQPQPLPLRLWSLERHPLGSQAFMPLGAHAYLVVVASGTGVPAAAQLRCFAAQSHQGVNYRPGIWHHPLLALDGCSDFLVVDRGGPAEHANCDEHPINDLSIWIEQP